VLSSVLIANRGEIARRIIRTGRRMGLRTIAVYSDADASAPHVREADAAVRIGPAAARDSYLRVDAIIDAAVRSGAAAVHPGYGFLSERPELPRACAAAGIVFVGPPADVVEAMGSKIGAKRLAVAAQVPVVPGFDGDDGSDDTLRRAAAKVGYPLLVKASAGGGGKGMRAVERAADLAEAIEGARREARAAFGDDRLLLERLVRDARHVEVQIAADHHGNTVHLFERDCSVQRNNQKVLEEAPAPNLNAEVRARLLADAVRLAASIGYRNLGTMEFLVDATSGSHYFLEMNTRLQVEHPVTELVTGLDLVELQLRIAAGERLPFAQGDVAVRGHSIEARLTAERPEAGFLPAVGRLEVWREPRAIAGVRIDSGVAQGSEVTPHYDSMIAKVIAHGADREEARRRLVRALDELVAIGVDTNRAFLAEVACEGPFARGEATTATLGARFPEGWSRPALDRARAAGIAAAVWAGARRLAEMGTSPWHTLAGFRVMAGAGRKDVEEFAVEIGGEAAAVQLVLDPKSIRILGEAGASDVHVARDGEALSFMLADEHRRGIAAVDGERVHVRLGDAEYTASVATALAAHRPAGSGGGRADRIVAPMPGIVAEVKVAAGGEVEKGAVLVVLESMKLFQSLVAPRSGRVAQVGAVRGQTVPAGFELVALEPETR